MSTTTKRNTRPSANTAEPLDRLIFTPEELAQYARDGYLVARGLFSYEEVERYSAHYMYLRENGTYPGDSAGVPLGSPDATMGVERHLAPARAQHEHLHY